MSKKISKLFKPSNTSKSLTSSKISKTETLSEKWNRWINSYKIHVDIYEHRHYILTALILGSGIVFIWRGIWNLADIYLFPGQDVASAIASFIIGFFVLYIPDFDLNEFMK